MRGLLRHLGGGLRGFDFDFADQPPIEAIGLQIDIPIVIRQRELATPHHLAGALTLPIRQIKADRSTTAVVPATSTVIASVERT